MDYRNKIEIEVQCYIFDHHEEKDITAEYRVCDRKTHEAGIDCSHYHGHDADIFGLCMAKGLF